MKKCVLLLRIGASQKLALLPALFREGIRRMFSSEMHYGFCFDLTGKLEIPILGQPQDFIYPYRMFYDSFYHLNHEGRNLHTNRIIQLLDLALEN